MTFSMCRVCLVGNSRMLNIDNLHLVKMYEKLTNTKLNTEEDNRMPSTICYVCHRQLQKCLMFFNMAHKSNRILRKLLEDTDKEAHSTISLPSQERMHNLVVTSTEHLSINICSNILCAKKEQVSVKNETADADTDNEVSKLMTPNVDGEKSNSLAPTQHIASINICSNTTSISPVIDKTEQESVKEGTGDADINDLKFIVTVKVEQVAEKEETAQEEVIDEELLKLDGNKDVEQSNNSMITDLSKENNIDAYTNSMNFCFYCDICNKKFVSKYLLVKHLKVHAREKLYSCNRCNKAYSQKGNLTRHMKSHTRKMICNRCDKSFTDKRGLRDHMEAHIGKKPYSCINCDKAFTKKSNLTSHMRIHTGEKPYSCNNCQMTFTQTGNLRRHMLVHTGEKPYSCKWCDKAFTKICGLKSHMLIHTEKKTYSCNMCDKAFTKKSDLTRHMLVHSGKKLYFCKKCSKAFTYKYNLKIHMRIHTGEKPYICTKCPKVFRVKHVLIRHMRVHTGEAIFMHEMSEGI